MATDFENKKFFETVNKKCEKCIHDCKQSARVVVYYCKKEG